MLLPIDEAPPAESFSSFSQFFLFLSEQENFLEDVEIELKFKEISSLLEKWCSKLSSVVCMLTACLKKIHLGWEKFFPFSQLAAHDKRTARVWADNFLCRSETQEIDSMDTIVENYQKFYLLLRHPPHHHNVLSKRGKLNGAVAAMIIFFILLGLNWKLFTMFLSPNKLTWRWTSEWVISSCSRDVFCLLRWRELLKGVR